MANGVLNNKNFYYVIRLLVAVLILFSNIFEVSMPEIRDISLRCGVRTVSVLNSEIRLGFRARI